jgi:hypothetical protein
MNTIIKNMVPDGEKWENPQGWGRVNRNLWLCSFGACRVSWHESQGVLTVGKGDYRVSYVFGDNWNDSRQVVAAYEKMMSQVIEMDNYDLSRHGEEE